MLASAGRDKQTLSSGSEEEIRCNLWGWRMDEGAFNSAGIKLFVRNFLVDVNVLFPIKLREMIRLEVHFLIKQKKMNRYIFYQCTVLVDLESNLNYFYKKKFKNSKKI